MSAAADRLGRFFFPERALDDADRGALRADDRAHNAARFRVWLGPLLALHGLVTWFYTRLEVHGEVQRLWLRNYVAILWLMFANYALALAALLALRGRARLQHRAVALMVAGTYLLYAAAAVNGQRAVGTVLPYVFVITATPYFFRTDVSWYYAVLPPASAVVVAGVLLRQPSAIQRWTSVASVTAFTLALLAFVRMQRVVLVNERRLRGELERFNAGLEARVAEQTRALRGVAQRLDEVLEAERRRLARDLHDDLGQELTALRLEAEALRARLGDDGTATAALRRMEEGVARALDGVRAILESLRPRILDEEGLEASLRWLARQLEGRARCVAEVDVVLDDEPTPEVALAAFRVAQEAMTNVARHADASRVWVRLIQGDAELALEVDDDGGADAAARPGRGIVGMRERVMGLGGELTVAPREPRGTRVRAWFPLRAARGEGGTA